MGRVNDPDDGRHVVGTTRLEAFSDGVFAIAITLLVLDLAVGASGDAWSRLVDGWPFYLAYVVSFATIGAAWLAHTSLTDGLARADLDLLRINLLLLLAVAVLPFPTRLVAESIDQVSDQRVFVPLYGAVLLVIRLLLSGLHGYARREGLYEPGALAAGPPASPLLPLVVAYGSAMVAGVVVPVVAVAVYCAIAVVLLVPVGEVRRLLRRGR